MLQLSSRILDYLGDEPNILDLPIFKYFIADLLPSLGSSNQFFMSVQRKASAYDEETFMASPAYCRTCNHTSLIFLGVITVSVEGGRPFNITNVFSGMK